MTAAEKQDTPAAGWYRSPGGVLSHAAGTTQARAFTGRGYSKVDDAKAVAEVGDGITLHVSRADSAGTFDDRSARQAVADEGGQRNARARAQATALRRSEAARKGAATRAAKKAAADRQAAAEGSGEED